MNVLHKKINSDFSDSLNVHSFSYIMFVMSTSATSRIRSLPRPTTICSVSLPARISTTLTVCAIPSRNGSRPARR